MQHEVSEETQKPGALLSNWFDWQLSHPERLCRVQVLIGLWFATLLVFLLYYTLYYTGHGFLVLIMALFSVFVVLPPAQPHSPHACNTSSVADSVFMWHLTVMSAAIVLFFLLNLVALSYTNLRRIQQRGGGHESVVAASSVSVVDKCEV